MTHDLTRLAQGALAGRIASKAAEPVPAACAPGTAALAGERLRDKCRELAQGIPPKLQLAYARAFCGEVVSRYWPKAKARAKFALRSVSREDGPALRADALAVADAVATHADGLALDDSGYLIGRIYAAMLPDDFRSANGVYYTPPGLAARLLDLAEAAGVDWKQARVLDPSCGGGAFLGPVTRRIVKHLRGADRRFLLRNLATRLAGYEVDAFAGWLSAVFLDATLVEEAGMVGGDELSAVTVCDALRQHERLGGFDLVVGNPPYGRVTLDAGMRAVYKRSLYGHANLYGLFLDLALRHATVTGAIAFVTPTSFLSGEYFRNLRALLVGAAPPVSLDFVAQRAGVFDDVLQETTLAVFKNGGPARHTAVSFLEVSPERVAVQKTERVEAPADARPWIVPRSPSAVKLAARLRTMPTRLADWGYRVATGPLVWNRFKPRLRQQQVKGAVPLVWAEAVTVDGEFLFRAARRNHAPYFIAKPEEEFLLVRRPCVLLQRTTAKEQLRRLIAAELPQSFLDTHGAVTVENHLNMMLPNGEAPAVAPAVLAAFLNSSAADRAFRCISGSVAVSAYELEAMPLPSCDAMERVAAALDAGATRAAVNALCSQVYGDV